MAAPNGRVSLDELTPFVSEASKQYGVPEEHIWNVIRAENSGSPRGAANLTSASSTAISPKNARGIMQVTPVALQDVQEAGLIPASLRHDNLSVRDQINVGTAYLKRLMGYSDKPNEIYAMYNYGPKARFRMDQLPEETKGYLTKTGQRESTSTVEKSGGQPTGTFGQGMFNSGDLIQTLLNTATNQNAAIDTAGGRARVRYQDAAELGVDSIIQQREAVQQAAVNAGSKAAVEFQQNKAMQDLQKLYGMDPEAAQNEISNSLATAQVAREARVSARAEYDEVASRDLLTNPIGYLIGQLQMPALAAKNNALADQEDLALQNIDTRTRQLTAAKNTLTANTADGIRQVQLNQAQVESKISNAKLTAEEAKNSAAIAASEMQLAGLENVKGDNLRGTLSTIATLEDRAESRELRKGQRDEVMSLKQAKADEEARFNERLARVSKTLGMVEPMTYNRLKTLTNKDQQQAWTYVAQNGQLGPDMESNLRFYLGQGNKQGITNTGGASTRVTAEKLARAAASYEGEAVRALSAGGKPPKREDAISQAYKTYQEDVVNSMSSGTYTDDLGSPKWDGVYNPYQAPFLSFNKAITDKPQLALLKNNRVKLMIDDLVRSGAVKNENLTSDQQQEIIKGLGQLVIDKKLDPRVAASDIAAYFSGAAAFNTSLNTPDLFSLPRQTNYLFTLRGTFGAGNSRKTDLMDPTSVENTLIWRARRAGSVPDGLIENMTPQQKATFAGPFGFGTR